MTTPPAARPRDRRDQLAEVVLELTAQRGLDAVSVREVAAAAGVSIGTVQHHFPTKDALLVAAFERIVGSTRERVSRIPAAADLADQIVTVLEQLLPLDQVRTRETRVYVAFAARAATTPGLGAIQAALLTELREELADVLGGSDRLEDAALLLAVVDGLALHQVSSTRPLPNDVARRVLARAVAAVLHHDARDGGGDGTA